jgi:hypothetical protein
MMLTSGYCSTDKEDHRLDTSLPVCPAFKEIGKRLGPFDLALIPIGAYAPRFQMSPIHNAPIDAVRMFKDLVSLPKCMMLMIERKEGYRNALGNLEDGVRPRR